MPRGRARRYRPGEFEDTSTAVAQGTTHRESSSSAAKVPGTGSPSIAVWAIVREVDTQGRRLDRLSHDRGHLFDVVGVGGFVLRASLPIT